MMYYPKVHFFSDYGAQQRTDPNIHSSSIAFILTKTPLISSNSIHEDFEEKGQRPWIPTGLTPSRKRVIPSSAIPVCHLF